MYHYLVIPSLLFLLPPSYMVAPIGNIANTSSFSTNLFNISTTNLNNGSTNPTMSSMNSIGMDIQAGQGPVHNSAIRGRNLSSSVNLSRESSLVSSGCSTPYYNRMNTNVDFPPSRKVSNLKLSYCYDSMLKELSKELTLVLSDIRELDRVSSTE